MNTKRLVQAVIGTLVVAIAVPAGADEPVRSARELAGEISAAGVGCDDYEKQKPAGLVRPSSQGRCSISGERVTLRTYKEQGQFENALGVASTAGCAFARGLGISTVPYVLDVRWYVTGFDTRAASRKVAKALGAKATIFDCRDD